MTETIESVLQLRPELKCHKLLYQMSQKTTKKIAKIRSSANSQQPCRQSAASIPRLNTRTLTLLHSGGKKTDERGACSLWRWRVCVIIPMDGKWVYYNRARATNSQLFHSVSSTKDPFNHQASTATSHHSVCAFDDIQVYI